MLLVGIGWGTGVIAKLWNTPAAVTALDEIERAPDAASAAVDFDGGQATAHWSQSVGKVVLVAEGLPQLPTDRTFELWFVRGWSLTRQGYPRTRAGGPAQTVGMAMIGAVVGAPLGEPPAGSTVTAMVSPGCIVPVSSAVAAPPSASNVPAGTGSSPRTNHSSNVRSSSRCSPPSTTRSRRSTRPRSTR